MIKFVAEIINIKEAILDEKVRERERERERERVFLSFLFFFSILFYFLFLIKNCFSLILIYMNSHKIPKNQEKCQSPHKNKFIE